MSVRLLLVDPDKRLRFENSNSHSTPVAYMRGMIIRCGDEGPYMDLGDNIAIARVPPFIPPNMVREFSYVKSIAGLETEAGEYKMGSARGVVTGIHPSMVRTFRIKAPSLVAAQRLFSLLIDGRTDRRVEPFRSYDFNNSQRRRPSRRRRLCAPPIR